MLLTLRMRQGRHITPFGKTLLERFKLFLNLVVYPNPGFRDCITSSCLVSCRFNAGVSITQIEVTAFQKLNLPSQEAGFVMIIFRPY